MSSFHLVIHNGGKPPLELAVLAHDHLHAQIIGLHTGLHRGIVSKVEATPITMKTKNNTHNQLLLALG